MSTVLLNLLNFVKGSSFAHLILLFHHLLLANFMHFNLIIFIIPKGVLLVIFILLESPSQFGT